MSLSAEEQVSISGDTINLRATGSNGNTCVLPDSYDKHVVSVTFAGGFQVKQQFQAFRSVVLAALFSSAYLCVPGSACAEATAGISACAALQDKVRAAECLQSLTQITSDSTSVSEEGMGFGDWQIHQRASDSRVGQSDVFLLLDSKVETTTKEGGVPEAASLVLRCQDDKTSVFVTFENARSTKEDATPLLVTSREGNRPLREEKWTLSRDRKALFPTSSFIQFAKRLKEESEFRVWFLSKSGEPQFVRFATRGLRTALVPLMKACHWG